MWGTSYYSLTVFRFTSPVWFRLVVSLTRLEDLARAASATAVRMDKEEAPQRELDRQKKETTDAAAAKEKAKTENKAQFTP